MKKGSKSVRDPQKLASELEQLRELNSEELRERWQTLFGAEPPPKLRSSLIVQGIAYRLQEKALGGLKPATVRSLERIADDAAARRHACRPDFGEDSRKRRHRFDPGMARHQASGDRAERRIPIPRQALSLIVANRTSDYRQSLVGAAVLRPEGRQEGADQ